MHVLAWRGPERGPSIGEAGRLAFLVRSSPAIHHRGL
jgi:hypothetical protein